MIAKNVMLSVLAAIVSGSIGFLIGFTYLIILCGAICAVFLVFSKPMYGVLMPLVFEFSYLIFVVLNLAPNAVSGAGFMLLLVATISVSRRSSGSLRSGFDSAKELSTSRLASAFLGVALVWGSVVGLQNLDLLAVLNGIRVFVMPVLMIYVVLRLFPTETKLLIQVVSLLLIVNLIAAGIEVFVGTQYLIDIGLQYGTHLRQIDGVLRAPGLMRSNVYLGLAAAAFLLGYWLTSKELRQSFVNSKLVSAAGLSSLIAVVLSTTRSAVVLLLVGLLLSVGIKGTWQKAAYVVLASIGVVYIGAGNVSSFLERIQVWGSVLQTADFFGGGWGSAGSASYSAFNFGQGAFSDNAFLSWIQQLGLPVSVLLVIALAIFTQTAVDAKRLPTKQVKIVATSLVVTAMVIEIWDYWPVFLSTALWLRFQACQTTEIQDARFVAA